MSPFLSIVIPAFNEEKRLVQTLEKILSHLTLRQLAHEIIVVDDCSDDATSAIAQDFQERRRGGDSIRLLRNEQNRGKGFSVRRGMLAAQAPFALMTDADLSTPIEESEKLEREVAHGSTDIAFGSRALRDSRIAIRQSWFRENSGKVFNLLVRTLTGLPFHDTQCGFKLFRMATCRTVFERQTIDNFSFDVELLYIAAKQGLRMKEVPVVWRHAEGSKVRFATDAPRMFVDLLRIRLNDAKGKYA